MLYIWSMERKKIKVRFNLGRGANYLKWKVEWRDGRVEYFHPIECQLILQYCQLKNSRRTALRIFHGENKTVCAWILCENLVVRKDFFIRDETRRLRYNPRTAPYWRDGEKNVDNEKYDHLHTIDYGIYIGN